MSFYFPNVDPVYIYRRKGTSDDPFLPLTQTIKVVNARVILREIPDFATKVKATNSSGTQLIEVDINTTTLTSNQFKVDYTQGIVFLHNSQEGIDITFEYKGTGYVNMPAHRITLERTSEEPEQSLQDLMNELGAIDVNALNTKIGNIDGLNTSNKTSTVHAINEVNNKATSISTELNTFKETTSAQLTELDSDLNSVTAQLADIGTQTVKKSDTGVLNLNVFDEPTRNILQGQEPGTINAVLGEKNVKNLNIDNEAVHPLNTNFLKQSPNIFNKNDLEHGYDINSTGEKVENNLLAVTGYIDVKPGEWIQFPEDMSFGMAFYDADKNFIMRKSKSIGQTENTASSGAYYMRIIVAISNLTRDIMINKGTIRYPFEPFGVTFNRKLFTNNPDNLSMEIQEAREGKSSLKERLNDLEDSIIPENRLTPFLTNSITTPTQGRVIMTFYENRTFGVNGSRTQIWYCDDGEINERKDFIVDSNMAFSDVVAISKTKVLAHNDNDSSLYLIENKNGTPIAAKVLEWIVDKGNFSFSTDLYPRVGGARMILMAEYGTKDPVDYPRHVHLSEDGGHTWRIIFELPNEEEGRTHTHGVHYDPYADRIWVCNGDAPATNLWYSDDWRNTSPTWTRVFPSLNAPTQFTSIYSTPKKVLFGTDGAQNGIWVVEKDVSNQKKAVAASDVKPYFIIDPSNDTNYVGRRFLEYPGSKGIFIVMSDAGTTRGGAILASPDGEKWFQIIKKEPSTYRLIYLTLYKNKMMYSYGGDVYETVVEWYNE